MRRYPPPKPSRWRDVAPGGQGTVRTGGKPGWAKLRKQTLDRDGHQRTFVSRDGVRCTTTQNLHVHHLNPGTELIVPLEQLAVGPGASHGLLVERPELCNAIIGAFLR
jgi:hypothetical protein